MKITAEILEKVDLWGQQKNHPVWIPEDYEPQVVQNANWVLPTIQQVRSELSELVDVILANGKFGTALETGLGRWAGTSRVWLEIFDKVISIEFSKDRIEKCLSREGNYGGQHVLVHGTSQSQQVFDQVKDNRLDFLFLDSGHTYGCVRGEYEAFSKLVNPGGIIAFHDVLPLEGAEMYEVYIFLKELARGDIDGRPHDIKYIVNSAIGLAFEII